MPPTVMLARWSSGWKAEGVTGLDAFKTAVVSVKSPQKYPAALNVPFHSLCLTPEMSAAVIGLKPKCKTFPD